MGLPRSLLFHLPPPLSAAHWENRCCPHNSRHGLASGGAHQMGVSTQRSTRHRLDDCNRLLCPAHGRQATELAWLVELNLPSDER